MNSEPTTALQAPGPQGARARHIAAGEARRLRLEADHWSIYVFHPGASAQDKDIPDGVHWPTVISCGRSPNTRYRGACLACAFEGPDQRRMDTAVEDAHDHTHPAWRDQPAIEPRPEAAIYRPAVKAKWLDAVHRAYPEHWFTTGGPIITYRTGTDTLHHPFSAPGGGYDLGTGGRRLPDAQRRLTPERRTALLGDAVERLPLFDQPPSADTALPARDP